MDVWILNGEANHRLSLASEIEYFHDHFVARRMAKHWKPPAVTILGKTLPIRDFVSWQTPVISEKARAALEPLISKHCEMLPFIELRRKMYYAINVLTTVDCLDVQASDVTYSPNEPGRIVNIWRYVFQEDKIPADTPIFKIADDHYGSVFVTAPFVEAVRSNHLRGAPCFLIPLPRNSQSWHAANR